MMLYDNITLMQAVAIQEELSTVLRFNLVQNLDFRSIAGADISFNKGSNTFYAAIVVLRLPDMRLISYSLSRGSSDFPYIPGFLGFREIPSLLKAWEMITEKPDLLVLDGQGILHPRRMGIAAHFGVLTHQLTIGCAKNSLFGKYAEPGILKYSESPVYAHGGIAGYALRTKDHALPVFVSPGYGMDASQAVSVIRKCIGKYRIPEPTRIAHDMVNRFRTGDLNEGYHIVPQNKELF